MCRLIKLLFGALTVLAATAAQAAVPCQTCPSDAEVSAIGAGIGIFRINNTGGTSAYTGGTLPECTTLLIQANLSYIREQLDPAGVPRNGAAFTGGTGRIEIDEGSNGTIEFACDVTPADMADTIVGGNPATLPTACPGSVQTKAMKTVLYNVPAGVSDVRILFHYAGGIVLLSDCSDRVSADPDRHVLFAPCLDDGNVCTTDTCETRTITEAVYGTAISTTCAPITGDVVARDGVCLHTPVVCQDDGNVCNGPEHCVPGQGCVSGPPLVCADDGNVCNGPEHCVPGQGCVSGPPLECADDGNVCNGPEHCVPGQGCVSGPPLECADDGNQCNGPEHCVPGQGCVSGPPLNCDDGNTCTDDTCNPSAPAGTDPCVHTPNATCQRGCTPGFWKNCTASWPTSCPGGVLVTPTTLVEAVFDVDGAVASCPALGVGKTLGGATTLVQALSFQGGSTINGGAQILLRAATAGVVNACNGGYPLSQADIISQVNAALFSCDRATMVALAGTLDRFNNLGCRDADGNDIRCRRLP